ncbi:hypothetical protein FN846DRAFT_912365 [Sphaerosporella brunnea]|uniref:Uncharacterized protein n=1 Tax=Sphaerosporella brunnea TaxID=1250544 RepID=A0A5J5EI40_9PEZI|nr:hypothetical protein FN846DRAFT_912365 [Sphaerosporella brunnea]
MSICENLAVGEDGVQAYVGCREQIIVLPERAPLSWIVSRVAAWYWGAGDRYSLAVLLADCDLTHVELDCAETWVPVASDPKARSDQSRGNGHGAVDMSDWIVAAEMYTLRPGRHFGVPISAVPE